MTESNTPKYLQPIMLFALILLTLFLVLIRDLIVGLLLGFIVAAITIKLYDGFLRISRGRESLAAGLSVLFIFLIVVVPFGFTGYLVANDLSGYLDPNGKLRQDVIPAVENLWVRFLQQEEFQILGIPISVTDLSNKVQEFATNVAQVVLSTVRRAASNITGFLLVLITFLYTLYFGYRDGRKFLYWLIGILPFQAERGQELIQQFHTTALAVFRGTLVIGLVQGILGGILLWATGVPTPFLWSVVMIVLSIIPGLGVQLVLVPSGIFLIAGEHVTAGVIVLVVSIAVIGTVDNLLRPILVGRETKMHELLIFVSTIGGLIVLGAPGLIIGPIIAALLRTSLRYYQEHRAEMIAQ